ncbi:MAG TPA: hypothetical protein VLG28_14030 [Acidimicrobiia bacterium]|nr:hypothetical protein [Acidimicrobiia bacterium]
MTGSLQLEPTTVRAAEVDAFATAVAGLHIDYVRTGAGHAPCVVTAADTGDATLSVGSVGFSVIADTEIPSDRNVFALITVAPRGAKWNGMEVRPGDVFAYAPSTTFVGIEPAEMAAAILVTPPQTANRIASDLGLGDPVVRRSVAPLARSPGVRRVAAMMQRASLQPGAMSDRVLLTTLVEAEVGVMKEHRSPRRNGSRRLDSRAIVRNCLDYTESERVTQPSLSELCRAGFASESRVRQAFIDVLGVPPSRYFQLRLLSRLRSELVAARPERASVTEIAMSLGVTQLGRVAGRHKSAYGELPSATLRRN